jgi:predicted transcriptional regulator
MRGPVALVVLLARSPEPAHGNHVLDHPIRRGMMETISSRPGVTLGELRKLFPLGWGASYHHLGVLVRAGLIRTERIGRRLVVTPVGALMDLKESRARAYLRNEIAARICADVFRHPGADVAGIAMRTGQTERAVYYHVRALIGLGLVASRSRARQFALHAKPLYVRIASQDSAP